MGISWKATGDGYQFDCGDGLLVEVERLSEEAAGLTGEITVYSANAVGGGLKYSARMNLMAPNTRATVVNALAERDKTLDKPTWARIIERVCFVAREEWRKGDPPVNLWDIPERTDSRWLLEPFLESEAVTILYADGGSGKSVVALAMAASVQTGHNIIGTLHGPPRNTLYLDYEADPWTHRERLAALYEGTLADLEHKPMLYKRMSVPLASAAVNLKRYVCDEKIGLVIVDSMGMARGAEAKDVGPTIQLFLAARSFGVPVLIIDHISKEAIANKQADKPFGSIYTYNEARATWLLEKEQQPGSPEVHIVLTQKKANNGLLQKRQAFCMTFVNQDNGRLAYIQFRPEDIRHTPQLHGHMDMRDKIMAELLASSKGLEIKQIAEAIDASQASVRARLNEMANAGKVVRLGRGLFGASYQEQIG